MVHLKSKIRVINSLPDEKKEFSIDKLIIILITIIIIMFLSYLTYVKMLPYINSININEINGKKVYFNECNTKDYIIINKDKSFTMSITNDNCESDYYEGNITIKYNEIIFNDLYTGIIDNDYNIIINNHKFEVDNEK